MALLTNSKVEELVIKRVKNKATAYGKVSHSGGCFLVTGASQKQRFCDHKGEKEGHSVR